MKEFTLLKDNLILTGFKSGKVTDARLKLMTKFLSNLYGEDANNYQFMVNKIKKHFKVVVTTGRLHVYYIHQEEIENKKSETKYINY
jgi:ClpP class serine protease